jgi:tight adherence protein B
MIWLEVIDDLISAIRAGLPIAGALAQVGQSGPPLARPACDLAATHFAITGNFASSLAVLRAEAKDPVADRITAALLLAHELGGSRVVELLQVLNQTIREEQAQRAQLVAKQSWTVNGARIAVLAPWLTAAVLALRPAARAAYLSVAGMQLLAGSALVTAIAYLLMTWMARLPKPHELKWRAP